MQQIQQQKTGIPPSIVGLVFLMFFGIMFAGWLTLSSNNDGVIESARTKPKKQVLAQAGETYTVASPTAGPRYLTDRSEVVKAMVIDDHQGLLEMAKTGRIGAVNPGEKVKVIDIDASFTHGTWVQVRVVEGLAKGTFWIRQEALSGF